ncbi:MAG: hypothetical protein K9H16_03700 [Bacteroidales bacterium]|nr:hypothetical protein [Bacteroidales bacterium]
MKKLIFILLIFPQILFAQIEPDPANTQFLNQIEEQLVCFTDRNLYLSGEKVWFSAFLLINNKMVETQLSEVLFVELYDRATKVISAGKYHIEGNLCSGNLQIPPETLSDAYFLRFYTKYQRNQSSDAYGMIPLTIVNTELTLPAPDKNFSVDKNAGLFTDQIVIETDKKHYGQRSKIKLDFSVPSNFDGFYCITVTMHKSINSNKSRSLKNEIAGQDAAFYNPDVRGVSVSGFVRDKQSALPVSDIPVFLTAFGNNNLLRITETKSNGMFLFALNKMEGKADVFVSIDPSAYKNVEVLINNDFSNQFSTLPDHYFNVDTSFRDLLSVMLVNFETRKTFGNQSRKAELQKPSISNLPTTYDFSVRLDDFIDLATLQEVFYELVPPVSVKSDKSEKYLAVANYQTQQVSRAALIILDDAPVFDVNELLKISPANIESINVINRPYYLGDHLLTSIVSLKTKTGDFGGYKFPPQSIFLEYQTLSGNQIFETVKYADAQSKNSPIPDFRTTLYWNPSAQIKNTHQELSFYTSDARGEYDIVIGAVSKDGSVIYGTSSIVVE